jgi:hypothetical protein
MQITQIQIRWRDTMPPLNGGGWETSLDGGATWNATTQKEVRKLTNTQLVLWN